MTDEHNPVTEPQSHTFSAADVITAAAVAAAAVEVVKPIAKAAGERVAQRIARKEKPDAEEG